MKNHSLNIIAVLLTLCICLPARADTFGSGGNAFQIDFVAIGNAGNIDDTMGAPNPAGKVDYEYRIGKYEISEGMIDKANAMGSLGIAHDGRGANKPVTSITWYEAAEFVNWLNTSSGGSAAYKFDSTGTFQLWQPGDTGYDSANPYRNRQAQYVLPSMDEWYKAAYYRPDISVFYEYATGLITTAATSGTALGTAVFDQSFGQGPADITSAGGLSFYGTMGQGGNVWEWEETAYDLANDSNTKYRGLRGGGWYDESFDLAATFRDTVSPSSASGNFGFRVASVPEPGTLLLGMLGTIGLLMRRRRWAIPGHPSCSTRRIPGFYPFTPES